MKTLFFALAFFGFTTIAHADCMAYKPDANISNWVKTMDAPKPENTQQFLQDTKSSVENMSKAVDSKANIDIEAAKQQVRVLAEIAGNCDNSDEDRVSAVLAIHSIAGLVAKKEMSKESLTLAQSSIDLLIVALKMGPNQLEPKLAFGKTIVEMNQRSTLERFFMSYLLNVEQDDGSRRGIDAVAETERAIRILTPAAGTSTEAHTLIDDLNNSKAAKSFF